MADAGRQTARSTVGRRGQCGKTPSTWGYPGCWTCAAGTGIWRIPPLCVLTEGRLLRLCRALRLEIDGIGGIGGCCSISRSAATADLDNLYYDLAGKQKTDLGVKYVNRAVQQGRGRFSATSAAAVAQDRRHRRYRLGFGDYGGAEPAESYASRFLGSRSGGTDAALCGAARPREMVSTTSAGALRRVLGK